MTESHYLRKENFMFDLHYFKSNCLVINTFLISVLLLSACSNHVKETPSETVRTLRVSFTDEGADKTKIIDAWEGHNRGIFRFNKGLDKVLTKPLAKAYKFVLPELVDSNMTNFFSNLGDVSNIVNNALQLKPRDAINDSARLLFNTSFGLGGFLDVATEMGLEKHHEDFGQTLAIWGVPSGPYLMLPVLGPSTLRDASARFSLDLLTDPVSYHDEALAITSLTLLDKRADLIATEDAFKNITVDQYSAIRDAWLQQRQSFIRDGKVDEKQQSDLIDELEALDAD